MGLPGLTNKSTASLGHVMGHMTQSQVLLADPGGMDLRTSVGAPKEKLMLFFFFLNTNLEPESCGSGIFRAIWLPQEATLGMVETIPRISTIPDFAMT